MFSVALIGPDGAGKTTIARMLEEQALLPFKYIYMGINLSASNFALPTSRWLEYLRGRISGQLGQPRAGGPVAPPARNGMSKWRSSVMAMGRLTTYLAEELYRQAVSWSYRSRGYVVVYDRHFRYDFLFEDAELSQKGAEGRLHRWFLAHLYPRPDLVIYLDAPAEVLFARKGEKGVEDLQRRREEYTRQMKQDPNCCVVDATQPLAKVCADVTAHILRLHKTRYWDRVPLQDQSSDAPPHQMV